MRLIDADLLHFKLTNWAMDPYTKGIMPYWMSAEILDMVDDAPTIDAEPVRHGEWRPAYDYAEYDYDGSTPLAKPLKFQDGWQCSLCGQYELSETTYCQNCGARMDKKEEEK